MVLGQPFSRPEKQAMVTYFLTVGTALRRGRA
jgi:hypothetical protein